MYRIIKTLAHWNLLISGCPSLPSEFINSSRVRVRFLCVLQTKKVPKSSPRMRQQQQQRCRRLHEKEQSEKHRIIVVYVFSGMRLWKSPKWHRRPIAIASWRAKNAKKQYKMLFSFSWDQRKKAHRRETESMWAISCARTIESKCWNQMRWCDRW